MKLRLSVACLLLVVFALLAKAEELKCDICGASIQGKYFFTEDHAVGGKKIICQACSKIEEVCFTCGLPVKEGYETLPDGRILCARDAKLAVHSEEEAKEICGQVKDDLDRLLSRYMTFPTTNILLSIATRFYLENLFKSPEQGQTCVSIYGATTSNPLPGNRIIHSVCVLSHLTSAKLRAVCAHEYTHAWMGENPDSKRKTPLSKDMVEAFCELIAYKYMASRQEAFQMEAIKKNGYTKGKIDVLIAADDRYGFSAVLDWMNSGDDAALDLDNLERIRAINGVYVSPANLSLVTANTPAAVHSTPPPQPAPGPATLTLKGISGSGQHRFALINDATFEAMEKGRVRLGQTNLMVRCLEIHNDSVTIQVDGSPEKKQLFLRAP